MAPSVGRSTPLVETQVAGASHGAEQEPRASVARIEVVVVERGGELAGEVGERGEGGFGELELPLEGPVELDPRVVGGALHGDSEERRRQDAEHAASEDAAEGGRAGTAQPGKTASGGHAERQPAQGHVRVAEDSEMTRGVVGAHPEGDGDQSGQCQRPHQPATRLHSKEKRATAAATMARARK
jgi:hypothetical protein